MAEIERKKPIQKSVSLCQSCQSDHEELSHVVELPSIDLSSFEIKKNLNDENSILFFSKTEHSYFFDLLKDRFPSELLDNIISEFKIVVTEEISSACSFHGGMILINPQYPLNEIFKKYDELFISTYNSNSKSGFKQTIQIESRLFNRGNQLINHHTLIFNDREFNNPLLEFGDLRDTERITQHNGIVFYKNGSTEFDLLENADSDFDITEICTKCRKEIKVSCLIRKMSETQIRPDKLVFLINCNQKFPFFSKVKFDQLKMIQFLFEKDKSTEITHFNIFLEVFQEKNKNLDWLIVNSDILTEQPQPHLFLNDLTQFAKILIEVLRETLTWKKDKFLEIHSVNKLTEHKFRIHDPFHVLGESNYRMQMMEWIAELEKQDFSGYQNGLKTIFR